MRIVGGEYRGRKLYAPDGEATRPTTDRVRESLFNILMPRTRDATVLDLFAGSGAVALEALSRGAAHAVLVDADRRAQAAIERNIALCRAEQKARLIKADWKVALDRLTAHFDLVFLDPPYAQLSVYGEAALALKARGLLAQGALLVMEHRSKDALALPGGFEAFDERRYGEATIAFVREVIP